MEVVSTQKAITKLIAEDRLDLALRTFLEKTDDEALLNLHNKGVILFAQFNKQKKDDSLGLIDYQDIVKTKSQINLALLDLIQLIPKEEKGGRRKKKNPGIRESKLKRNVRWIMVFSKILVLSYLIFLWDVGGFTNDQAIGTATLLIPLFTTYTVLMVRESIRNRYVHIKSNFTEMLLTHRFKRSTYMWLFAYTASLFLVLFFKSKGNLSYDQMSSVLTLVEIGIGVYVGEVVFALFKNG